MPDPAGPAGLLAVIAGRGALPRQIAEARAAAELPYLLIVFPDCFEPWMADHPHQHHHFEKVGGVFRALRRAGATHVVFAGAMNRPRVRPWRIDIKGLTVAARVLALLRKGDDAMLRGFAAIFEKEGLTMVGPTDILGSGLTVRSGPVGAVRPSAGDLDDARRAAAIVAALGPLDVGQGAVVAGGICLAVEAIEGTDLMLARVADLPEERRAMAPPPSGVLFKGPKPDQDMRLDMPAIGPATVDGAHAAGLAGIIVAAGQTLVTNFDEVRALADRHRLFVYGATAQELAPDSD